MLRSLRTKLAFTHFVPVLLVSAALAVFALRSYELAEFERRKAETFQTLYVFAGRVDEVENNPAIEPLVAELADALGGRALVLTALGRVAADSLAEHSLEAELLVLDELPEALSGNPVWAIYQIQRGKILYCAVPVTGDGAVQGVLLSATRLDSIYSSLIRFAAVLYPAIVWIALAGLVISVLLGYIVAYPWTAMVEFFEQAPSRDYGADIPERGHGDLARLARAYNLMAQRLRRTELVRRDFVVEASRQLEQPLKTILELAEPGAEDAIGRLRSIGQLAQQISTGTEQLVELARLELQSDQMKPEPADLGALVDEALEKCGTDLAEAKTVVLREDTIEAPVHINVDRTRFLGALMDLIRFCVLLGETGSRVGVAIAEDQSTAFLAVRGGGPVIPEADMPYIFERFLSRQRAGVGQDLAEKPGALLAIARRVIELHGGSIEARSNPGGGVTFFARIPKAV